MLDQDNNAALSALIALAAPMDRIDQELDAALDGFRSGNTRNPVLSAWLPRWLEKAWLVASAEQMSSDISTLDLLLALIRDESLRGALHSTTPSLTRLDQGRLAQAYHLLRQHDAQPVTHLKLCIEPVRRQTTGHTLYCNPQYGLMRCSRQ